MIQSSSDMSMQADGTVVGARPAMNYISGDGIITSMLDTGTALIEQRSIDSAFVETRANEQAGTTLLCASSSGSSAAYTCKLAPTLALYTRGMMLHWIPDVNGAGGPTTLAIDTLAAAPLQLANGADPEPGDIVAGVINDIWFDGGAFRLVAAPAVPIQSAASACGASTRGRLFFVTGTAGTKDSLSVCAKDAAGIYAWRNLY
jgi:hypothetical protein